MQLIAELGYGHREVGRARRVLTRALDSWGVGNPTSEVAVLLTSELVTNAIRHGLAPVRLRAGLARPGLRVEVEDDGSGTVATRRSEIDDVDGRGLQIVAFLADRWGCGPASGGKRVWFELHTA
jgi:anti-sigma regulatory factor (Ser/Thr protein kinase)